MTLEQVVLWVIGGLGGATGIFAGIKGAMAWVIKRIDDANAAHKQETADAVARHRQEMDRVYQRLEDCQKQHTEKSVEYAELKGKVSVLESMASLPQAVAAAVIAGLNKDTGS